jgi:hypothetical protein
LGLFDFLKKKTKPSSEKENSNDNNASLIVYTNKTTKTSNISFVLGNDKIWDNIPYDIKRVLYTSDADEYSSSSMGISLTISLDFSGKVKVDKNIPDDPSTIYFKAPISKPIDPSLIPRPPYYPSYAGLTPEQRYIYLKWLQDISTEIDVGYKFIFYYGLERHLLLGDFDNAHDMIIRLRKNTTNSSFRWYSLRALVYSLFIKNRPDLFYKLKCLYDDELWHDEQLLTKVFTDDIIEPAELIKILKSQEINKRYINNEHELYTEILEGILNDKFKHPYINPNDFISKKFSGVSSGILFANYSFPREIQNSEKIPTLDMSKFYTCIIDLHNHCHELTKSKLSEKRKNSNIVTVKANLVEKPANEKIPIVKKEKTGIKNKEKSTIIQETIRRNVILKTEAYQTIQAKSNIFSGYRYVATLSTKTCLACGAMDGKILDSPDLPNVCLNKNCRCLMVPVVRGMEELDADDTRVSENGPVPANWTYETWLKKQPAKTQKEILGERYKSYKEGIPLTELVKTNKP